MMDRGKQLRGAGRWVAMTAVLLLLAAAVAGMGGTHLTVRAADDTAGKTPRMLKIAAAHMAGNLETKVLPKYPAEARAHHNTIDGTTVLGLIVTKEGLPANVHVVKSLREDYDESAIAAVRQWRWKPYLLNGDPVEVETKVNVSYKLNP